MTDAEKFAELYALMPRCDSCEDRDRDGNKLEPAVATQHMFWESMFCDEHAKDYRRMGTGPRPIVADLPWAHVVRREEGR